MRIISKVAAIALVLFAAIPALTAGAEEACKASADAEYCEDSSGVDSGGSDAGAGAEVEPSTGGDAKGPVTAESGGPATAAAPAPSGALPITGGDVVGMATIGAVAIGLGALLVRRSKVAKQPAA